MYYRAYDRTGHERTAFSIPVTDSLADVDIADFLESVDKISTENNLFIFKANQENSDVDSVSIYLTNNDLYIKDWLMVDGASDYDLKRTYATVSQDRSTRISTFFYPVHVTVSSIQNSPTVDGFYSVMNLSGDMKTNLDSFLSQMHALYPDVQFTNESTSVFYEYQSDLECAEGLWNHMALKIALIFGLTLMLGAKIFKYHRQISIYKMEGYTSFQIYRILFLKPFILDFFIGGCISCGIIALYFFGGWESCSVFVELFILLFLQLIFLEIVASGLILAIIAYTPVVNGMKGKNKLVYVESLSFAAKMACVFLIIPYILPGLQGMTDFLFLQIRKEKVEAELENYYVVDSDLPSRYHGYVGQENYVALYDDLLQNHGLFSFGVSQFGSFEDIMAGNGLEFYEVGYEYLIRQNLIDEGYPRDQIIIALPKGESFDEILYINQAKTSLRTPREAKVIYYDTALPTFSIRDLYRRDVVRKIPVIYLPVDPEYAGQLNYHIFVSDRGYEETREMFNNIFYEHGFQPGFTIVSMKNQFARSASSQSLYLMHKIITFTAAAVALWMASRFMIQADIDNHSERYRAAYCEGVQPYSFSQYLRKIVLPTFFGIILFLFARRSFKSTDLLGSVLFLVVFEIVLYGYFLSYYRKEIRLMDKPR